MNEQWSEDALNYFVHLYRSHECLWNTRKGSYTSNPIRKAAFEDIAEKMLKHQKVDGLGVEEVKEKIYELRFRYNQVLGVYSSSSISPAEREAKWFKDIDFIVNNPKPKIRRGKDCLDGDPIKIKHSKVFKEPKDNASSSVELTPLGYKINNNNAMPLSSIKLKSRIAIMNVLKALYMEKLPPNYNIVFDILNKVALIQSNDSHLTADIPSFKHEMTKLGYILKETIDGKKILIENVEQRFERYIYLKKIKKIRACHTKPIVYIDERVINLDLKYEKLNLTDGLPPQSSLFFHAITNNGFVNGLFSNQATKEDFNKWVIDILLGLLKKPSVVVMDKSPIHGANFDTCAITRTSSKTKMIKWLIANDIPCSSTISRPELFELIQMNRKETKEYKIDKIIKSYGHEVLRLPDGFPELNMTDVFWNAFSEGNSMIKSKTIVLSSLQVLQKTIMDIMLPSMTLKKWYDLENTLIMKENEIHQIDIGIENSLESYEFM